MSVRLSELIEVELCEILNAKIELEIESEDIGIDDAVFIIIDCCGSSTISLDKVIWNESDKVLKLVVTGVDRSKVKCSVLYVYSFEAHKSLCEYVIHLVPIN